MKQDQLLESVAAAFTTTFDTTDLTVGMIFQMLLMQLHRRFRGCDITGWERHTSRRSGALFLHNPTTGESKWFEGWVEKTSKWYGRKYWFQPTTGKAEWDLPENDCPSTLRSSKPSNIASGSERPDRGVEQEEAVAGIPKPSSDKVKSWMEKIKAAKTKKALGCDGEDSSSNDGTTKLTIHKRRREDNKAGTEEQEEETLSDDMDVDDDDGDDRVMMPADFAADIQPPLPRPPPREDVPSVSLRRETLRQNCLERFAQANVQYGAMRGLSKTSRSCREEGMAVGLSGMFGRLVGLKPGGGRCCGLIARSFFFRSPGVLSTR